MVRGSRVPVVAIDLEVTTPQAKGDSVRIRNHIGSTGSPGRLERPGTAGTSAVAVSSLLNPNRSFSATTAPLGDRSVRWLSRPAIATRSSRMDWPR